MPTWWSRKRRIIFKFQINFCPILSIFTRKKKDMKNSNKTTETVVENVQSEKKWIQPEIIELVSNDGTRGLADSSANSDDLAS
jgi:Leu/Phe-tRNA-protein transferase